MLGALLTIPAACAQAGSCSVPQSTVEVPSGIGFGSLYGALQTGCIEVSTSLDGMSIALEGAVSSAVASPTLYLDTAGAPVVYTFTQSSTGSYQNSTTGSTAYIATTQVSGPASTARLNFDPSFSFYYDGVIDLRPGVELALGSATNLSAPHEDVLLDNASAATTLPTLGFSASQTYAHYLIVENGGAIDISPGQTVRMTGTVVGGGAGGTDSLTITGGGTLVMQGDFTNSGVLTVDSGTTLQQLSNTLSVYKSLQIDGTLDVSSLGSVTVPTLGGSDSGAVVQLGSSNLTLSQAADRFGGSIQGAGGVTLSAGTETLSGTSTYSGPTTVANGATLALAGSGSIPHSTLNIAGVLDISASDAAVVGGLSGGGSVNLGSRTLTLDQAGSSFSGTVSGAGGLAVTGGSQTLTGANQYTGPTSIGAGASLALSGTGSINASAVVADGTLDLSAASAPLSLPSLSGSGAVTLGSQPLSLSQASGTFDGSISGPGSLTLLAGSETLGGVNRYTGGTTVQGGSLTLSDGAALGSQLRVQAAGSATANGNTTVTGDVSNAGSLSVGGAAQPSSVMTVSGSYSQSSTGVLTMQVSPATNTTLQVQGAQLNLDGKLLVQALPGAYLRKSYLLVNAPSTTTLNGQFANWQVLGLSPAAYKFTLTYVADPQVLLTITALAPFSPNGPGGSTTPNQQQISDLLNQIAGNATGALFDRLSALLGGGSIARTLDQLDGQLYSQTPQWLLQGTQQEWERLFDRLDLGLQSDARPGEQAFAFIDGSHGRLLGDGNADGMAMSSSGLTLGRQLRRGQWELGAAVGMLNLGATRNNIGDGMTGSLLRIGAFAARPVGTLRLGALLGYTAGQVGYGMARREAGVWSLQTRVAHDFAVAPGYELTPLLSLDAQRLHLSGSTESDPLLGLQVGSQGVSESSSLAALRGVHAWQWHALSGDLNASLGMRHWWHRPPTTSSMSLTGMPGLSFTTWGVAPPRNVLEVSAGLHAVLRRNLNAELSLQGDYGRSLRAGRIEAHLSWGF